MLTTTITCGISLGAGKYAILVRPYNDETPEIEYNSYFIKMGANNIPEVKELAFVASKLIEFDSRIYVLGRLGNIAIIENEKLLEEKIDGPENFGFLSDIKAIEGKLYVVGASRQVYVRNSVDTWLRFDSGVLDESNNVDRITGFQSIDGVSEKNMCAVGLEGEIWIYNGKKWTPISSPTNVILEKIKYENTNKILIVGQAGVLMRGYYDSWDIIEQSETKDDFWDIQSFDGNVYINSQNQLYQLTKSDNLKPINISDDSDIYLSTFDANNGALWSFGLNKIHWTDNGKDWYEGKLNASK